jgi:4-hydroxybenzoate polyprenyltransferase
LGKLAVWGGLVKFSHSVFALPFALIMVVVIAKDRSVSFSEIILLVLSVVAARTAAMAFNRLIDASIDSANPRTQAREIPAGKVSKREAAGLVVLSSIAFAGSAAALGMHCLVLVPAVLAVLLGYSLLKRHTSLCHFVLGLALAMAPGGVWYALTATWSLRPIPLMIAVLTWVAGFDILYSCQDVEFDRRYGLYSLPQRLGVKWALAFSLLLHAVTVLSLFAFGGVFNLGSAYYCGVGLFSCMLMSQHLTVARRGIECIDQVFFTRNGAASLLLLIAVLIEVLG